MMAAKLNYVAVLAVVAYIVGSLVALIWVDLGAASVGNGHGSRRQLTRHRRHNPLLVPKLEPAGEPVISFPVNEGAASDAGPPDDAPPNNANNTVICNRLSQADCDAEAVCEWKAFKNNKKKTGMCKKIGSGSSDDDSSDEDSSDEDRRHLDDAIDELDHDVCDRVLQPRAYGNCAEEIQNCQKYESLPLIVPDCSERAEIVPRIIHTVSRDSHQSYHQTATSLANPSYKRNHHSDTSALEYVRSKCGEEAAMAYSCFIPPAYRADLFRFCAMYADGGVYLDGDIVPLIPVDHMYSGCSAATIGHDFPQAVGDGIVMEGKQMKIIASAPRASIFKCALDNVIENVRSRYLPKGSLMISGPSMLHQCYEKHSDDVAITYHDTRGARWPYTGLRAGDTIVAYEKPGSKVFMGQRNEYDELDYAYLHEQKRVYNDSCLLK